MLKRTCAVIAAALALAACQTQPPAPPPESAAAIQELMDAAVQSRRIPAALALLARGDEVLWIGTAGEMSQGAPMRADAIFPLASVGKMYTAVAAMILVERGMIGLDDPVSRYIPEFAAVRLESGAAPAAPITVRHLLTHTSGLTLSGDAFWNAWNENVGRTTTAHMARAMAALPLVSEPGARFNYGPTGASYEVLAAIVETASGQTLEDFMQQNIFTPLHLTETHFHLPDALLPRLPAFYRRDASGALVAASTQGEQPARSAYFHGGGGVQASPRDLVRFAQIFLNDGAVDGARILRPETVRMMMSDQLGERAPPGPLSWGIGAAVPRGATAAEPSQYGWIGGNYAVFMLDRRTGALGFFAFPLTPPGDAALLNEFRALAFR